MGCETAKTTASDVKPKHISYDVYSAFLMSRHFFRVVSVEENTCNKNLLHKLRRVDIGVAACGAAAFLSNPIEDFLSLTWTSLEQANASTGFVLSG